MKKALFVVALLGGMVASAETDSYLYWMVDDSSAPTYTKAAIRYTDSSSYLLNYYEAGGSQIGTGPEVSKSVIDAQAEWGDGLYAGVDSNDLPRSFVVELWNGDAYVGQSVIDWSVAQNYIYEGGMGMPTAGAVPLSSGFSIPEPSSGLLMLVGCAMLGLRRRRQKVA